MNETELRSFSHFQILTKIEYQDLSRNVPDQIGTLAHVGTSPNLGWPSKGTGGSQPV